MQLRVRALDPALRHLVQQLEQGFPFGVVRQLFERLISDAGVAEDWPRGRASSALVSPGRFDRIRRHTNSGRLSRSGLSSAATWGRSAATTR